jgi:PAS domain-containing protein
MEFFISPIFWASFLLFIISFILFIFSKKNNSKPPKQNYYNIPIPMCFILRNGMIECVNEKFKEIIQSDITDTFIQKNEGEFFTTLYNLHLQAIEKKGFVSKLIKINKKVYKISVVSKFSKDSIIGNICVLEDKTQDLLLKKKLKEKIDTQNILYKIEKILLHTKNNDFDSSINQVLYHLLYLIGAECAYFYEINDNNERVNFYEYKKSFVPSFKKEINKIKINSDFVRSLENHKIFIINNSLSGNSFIDKTFAKIGIVSDLEMSLYSENFKGMIGVCLTTQQKTWKETDISLLKIVGESILSVIEKRRVEQSLQNQKQWKESVVSLIPDMIFEINSEGTILNYSASDLSQLYYQEDEFLGKIIYEIFPSFGAKVYHKIKETLQTQTLHYLEYMLDGEYFETRMVPAGNNTVIAIVRNVTEMKKTLLDLKEVETTFSILTENSPLSIIIFSYNGDDSVYYINSKARQLLKYTEDEIDNLHIEHFIHEDDVSIFNTLIDTLNEKQNCNTLRIYDKENNIHTINMCMTEIKIESRNHILLTMIEA